MSISDDWNYWKSHLTDTDKGVPVFFRAEDNQIKDFGLALLYKLPYDKTPYDLLPQAHQEESTHDLAECIFGYTGRTDSLRGRVQFSNAFSTNAEPSEEVTLVLGTPKASYYPMYIEQTGSNGRTGQYQTYNNGRLAGWKRYHVRNGVWQKSLGNEKLDSTLTPVRSGATFTGDIVFHNLRPIELGALLSALTFHGKPDLYYHQLGQAKPYGYGRCRYSAILEGEGLEEPNYYMGHFEHELSDNLGTSWHQSPQIKELFALAGSAVSNETEEYKYMRLSTDPRVNEFQDAKGGQNGRGDKYYLPRFSKLSLRHASGPDSLSEGIKEQIKAQQLETLKAEYNQRLAELDTLSLEEAIRQAERVLTRLNEKMAHRMDGDIRAFYQDFRETFEAKKSALEDLQRQQAEEKAQAVESAARYEAGLEGKLSATKSLNANLTDIKKWLEAVQEQEGRKALNEEEIKLIAQVFQESYDTANAKGKKTWKNGSAKRTVAKVLGQDLADEIFGLLSIK